jgi:hypothetical protein
VPSYAFKRGESRQSVKIYPLKPFSRQ